MRVRTRVIGIRAIRRNSTVGSDIQKTRLCVVVAPDDMNAHLRTVIVAPMRTGSQPARLRIAITFQRQQSQIVLTPIRTLDRVRLVKRLGALRPATRVEALQTLQAMFALKLSSRRLRRCRCHWRCGYWPGDGATPSC